MSISFPEQPPRVSPNGAVVEFQAVENEKIRECAITAQALVRHFGATSLVPHELRTAFITGRVRIQCLARERLSQSAGDCLLLSADFEAAAR
jgi:hypothetical protein